ncbi:MAG: hypothetical protein JNL93_14180 [Pelomonas sp.]|nr:hypothetical protein [Roseateles sp.]
MAWIYQDPSFGMAMLKVAVVSSRAQADLLVYRSLSPGDASGDARWFITRDRQFARTTIHLCSLGMADLTICFVPTRGEAGWRVAGHRWQHRLR